MDTATGTSPEDLRDRMVDQITTSQEIAPHVQAVMRTVPRHRFLPDASLDDAYADIAVNTKVGDDGRPVSCASQPTVVAMMLDQLDVHPGHRVLEIGAGTGYNAALLAELVGDAGEVTTVDIFPDVTAQARLGLDATGYGHVRVVTGDGALGDPDLAPYDRIIVTVGPWDLPPAWFDQLVDGGLLVVPLHWRGQARSIAFAKEADHLRSRSMKLCGFIPMVGQDTERTATIDTDGQVTLAWDSDQPHDPTVLQGVLDEPPTTVWSGTRIDVTESLDGLWLRLTATEPGTCRLTATRQAIEAGLCKPIIPARSPSVVEGATLAYMTQRKLESDSTTERELGAVAYGPTGAQLANRLTDHIVAWGHHRSAEPAITAHPTATRSDERHDGLTIRRPHADITISYK